MRPVLSMAGLLLGAAALAGCSGDDGKSDVQGVATSTQTGTGDYSVSGSVSAGPGGAAGSGNATTPNGTASAQTSWSYDNRSGTISGNGAFVNVPFTKEETFTLQNGTAALYLNVTAQGHDLRVSVRAPGCADEACATEEDTQSGSASISIPTPVEGDWSVVLELDGVGPVQADYTLEIAKLGPGASA